MYLIRKGELKVFRGDRMPIGIYNEEEVCFHQQGASL